MPVARLLWGPTFENQLILGDPLFDLVTDREARQGSEWIQGTSGIEDAWIIGRDYILTGQARFLPDASGTVSPISGGTGWQAFLDWARDKNTFRFVPDQTLPQFYLDGCYLVEPLTGFGSLGSDLRRIVPFKFRNPNFDFHLALRGLMFEYTPGQADLASPPGLPQTFARAQAARFLNAAGLIETAASGVIRDRHYDHGRRVTLVEDGRTQLLTNQEALDNAAWAKNQVTVSPNVTATPEVSAPVTADKVVETAVTNVHTVLQAITITAGNTVIASGFFKPAERTQGRLLVWNGTDSFFLDFDTGTGGSGTGTGGANASVKASDFVAIGNGWWYFWVSGKVNAGSTAINVEYCLRTGGSTNYLGDVTKGAYFWGLHAEQISPSAGSITQATPAFYIPGTTQPPDNLTAAWPWGPQPMWFYQKFLYNGPNGNFGGGMHIGATGAGQTRFVMYVGPGVIQVGVDNNAVSVGTTQAIAPARGDEIEVLAVFFPDLSCKAYVSINGGADLVSATSGPNGPAPTAFATPTLRFDQALNTPAGILPLRGAKVGAGALTGVAAARAA